MLDLLWLKISERFRSIADAYRYFDVNFNNRVSFNEFQKGLDHLRIKYQLNQISDIFKYLDKDHKGYVSYNDFSDLAEEKRRHLDPFDYEA
jgi:Ca2+-binding EF-hand superfamily protein